jgi:hypothetical protein
MIHELKKKDYGTVRPLFERLEWNLITRAVIEGTSPGRVYVDRVEKPRTAFMCTVEGHYLAGYDSNDEFNTSLNELILENIFAGDTVRKGETDVAIGFHPDSWKDKMPIILKGRVPLTTARRHYVCTELKEDSWRDRVPKGFRLQRIDEKLLQTPRLEIPAHVTGWMKTNWGSISDFMEKGFGVEASASNFASSSLGVTAHLESVTQLNFTLEKGGTVEGQIRDGATDLPVPNAAVYLGNQTHWGVNATSDESGGFSFHEVPHGEYIVRVTAENYVDSSSVIQVLLGKTTFVELRLLKNPVERELEWIALIVLIIALSSVSLALFLRRKMKRAA